MANRVKATREDIISAAVKIVRQRGKSALNARSLAKALNCSIQPIYYQLGTMKKLREETRKEIKSIYNAHFGKLKARTDAVHFRDVGVEYLMFAYKEPNYYEALFMDRQNNSFSVEDAADENLDYIVSVIRNDFELTKKEAVKIIEISWLTIHGLAVMIISGYMKPNSEKIKQIMTDTFYGQIALIKNNKN